MGLKKRISLPSTGAGIFGGALRSENESTFAIPPDKFLIAAAVFVVVVKALHLITG